MVFVVVCQDSRRSGWWSLPSGPALTPKGPVWSSQTTVLSLWSCGRTPCPGLEGRFTTRGQKAHIGLPSYRWQWKKNCPFRPLKCARLKSIHTFNICSATSICRVATNGCFLFAGCWKSPVSTSSCLLGQPPSCFGRQLCFQCTGQSWWA